MKGAKSYEEAGVDLLAGDDASKLLFEASKRTWRNREGLPGQIELSNQSFSTVRFIDAKAFPDAMVGLNFDGVGTKIEVAERVGDHSTIAFDLFAMVCDDAARTGGEPIALGSILDCNKVSIQIVHSLAEGMVNAASTARVSVINGEIAELGSRIGGYGQHSYNWGACAMWLGKRSRMISASEIEPNQSIIALRETGFRSNGLSLVRKAFSEAYGEEWHLMKADDSLLGKAVLEPSRIYTLGITKLTGGYSAEPTVRVTGVAHITGGGIPGKLGRLLSVSKYGAVLEDLFEPCPAMLRCQDVAGVEDNEAYRIWNMGNGLLIITPEPDRAVRELQEEGFEARVVGKISATNVISIRNKAINASSNPWITFEVQS